MKFSRKTNQYEQSLEKLNIQELESLLEEHKMQIQKLRKGAIQQAIDEYEQYLTVQDTVRKNYEQLLKEYELANEILNFYQSTDKKLQDLYDWGLCDYFYKGSPDDIAKAKEAIEEIKVKLDRYEKIHPNLALRRKASIVIPSTVTAVYSNLLVRKQLVEKTLEKRKQNKGR